MRRIFLLAGLLWFLLSSVVVHAVPIGYISFDTLTPGSDGLNTFNINDLTGDPASGGSVFPSDFPVLDSFFNDQGEIYPETVDYQANHIVFNRESRTDNPTLYGPNFAVTTAYRLSGIDVYSNWNGPHKRQRGQV